MDGRDLNLSPRDESTREKFHTEVVRFELEQILQHFSDNAKAIKEQFILAEDLIAAGKKEAGETIWRSQIVFLASALDFYMHELTKFGLCEIFSGKWEHTTKYENIEIKMKVIETALQSGEEGDWFLDYINKVYEKVTMVSYDSIKEQLNLLGIIVSTVACKVFYEQGASEKPGLKLKRRLNELFDRRNLIAHQFDRTHFDAQINDISKGLVEDFMLDIEKIVQVLHAEAKSK